MTQIEEIKEKLPSLATDCADLHGSLDIFYVNKIMKFDFDLEELDWANKQFLGSGSFAEVFSSELKRKRRPVALKVASSPVKSDNVSEILMADRTMRELRHPNIIRYFGATYVKKTSGLVWIMVMDLCNALLKSLYIVLCNASLKSLYIDDINKDNHVPGMMFPEHPRRQAAVKRTLTHCLDIVKGLEYIHEKGFTHRDMKLENVLIGNEDVAKITDVGVTKPTSTCARATVPRRIWHRKFYCPLKTRPTR
ncbi:probable tyrosine-protein kinase kin-31 [Dreissena polymorpha]|uniref:probable tyrosine-protein kinase kin-31 n=1 Tax=Dreissena polymorpha TaxID=45954 RepID=UPI0022648375|nr:probable tyrosine-protein kinase kin-31 [Dreissena polymorpha]